VSYPPQGQDPNNPYAQPQQGQQPGYGYPQQGGQQPGYGYPQQQGGLPSYGGPADQGYPMGGGGYGMPMQMPGGVKAARVIMYVVAGFSIIGAIFAFIAAATFDDLIGSSATSGADASAMADLGAGVVAVIGVLGLIFAAVGIMLAMKFGNGGSGVRIGTIVFGSFMILFGLLSLPAGILQMVLGILVVVFVAKSDGNAWFNRPRY
jgi:hypothetical protein